MHNDLSVIKIIIRHLSAELALQVRYICMSVLRAETKQPVHSFHGDKGFGIQQGTSVWVGSPNSGSAFM